MTLEEAKTLLEGMGFIVLEGAMQIEFAGSDHKINEKVLGAVVSDDHQCDDTDCQAEGVHLIGTRTALALMTEQMLIFQVEQSLAEGNR